MNPEYTTGEAEAWREGWRAAGQKFAKALLAQAEHWAEKGFSADADMLNRAAHTVLTMQPPTPWATFWLGADGDAEENRAAVVAGR
jgi:hypothetical protein